MQSKQPGVAPDVQRVKKERLELVPKVRVAKVFDFGENYGQARGPMRALPNHRQQTIREENPQPIRTPY